MPRDNFGAPERRAFALADVRIEGQQDEPTRIVGHAAVFDVLSEDLGGFREKIAPGAFAKSLGGDIRALFNHNPDIVLGRTVAKTLRVAEDNHGLAVEIDPPETAGAVAVVEALRRGDVTQMSFGFRTIEHRFDRNLDSGEVIRTLIEVELFDVSPVTFSAYPQTDVAVRSFDAWQKTASEAKAAVDTGALDLMKARTRMASVP